MRSSVLPLPHEGTAVSQTNSTRSRALEESEVGIQGWSSSQELGEKISARWGPQKGAQTLPEAPLRLRLLSGMCVDHTPGRPGAGGSKKQTTSEIFLLLKDIKSIPTYLPSILICCAFILIHLEIFVNFPCDFFLEP